MSSFCDRLARPREGWLSLALLIVMLLASAWAMQRADWLEQSEYLVPVALWPRSPAPCSALSPPERARSRIPIAALFGALVLVWSIGGEYFPQLSQLGRLLQLREDFDPLAGRSCYGPATHRS